MYKLKNNEAYFLINGQWVHERDFDWLSSYKQETN